MKSGRSVPEPLQRDLAYLGKLVEERLGLAFSEKRRHDLWHLLVQRASQEKSSPEGLLRRLLREGISETLAQDMARHLTVGETYFFREPKTLRALESEVLPHFFSRKNSRSPRIWCAGCSSGEEAYTLAMMLHGKGGAASSPETSVFGTDINPQALAKARRGTYGPWSFRNVPEISKALYFDPLEDGTFSVKTPFRKRVSFSLLNLSAPEWSLWKNTPPPEIIFCRNVLIYFTERHREDILRRFHALLPPSGWLVVAPCETSALLNSQFLPVYAQGATLYRKAHSSLEEEKRPFFFFSPLPSRPWEKASPVAPLLPLLSEEVFPEASSVPPSLQDPFSNPEKTTEAPPPATPPLEEARNLANRGNHEKALEILEKTRQEDRTSFLPLYLMGLVYSDLGEEEKATEVLRKALFLEPEFIMAHYALGTLAFKKNRPREGERHFRNAIRLLEFLPPETPLPEGEGIRREDLLHTIQSSLHQRGDAP